MEAADGDPHTRDNHSYAKAHVFRAFFASHASGDNPCCAGFSAVSAPGGAPPADEATFGWAKFEAGSYVRFQIKTISSYGLRADSNIVTVLQTLVSKADGLAQIDEDVTDEQGETKSKRIKSPLSASALFAGSKNRRPSRETIKVAGNPLDCFTVEFPTTIGGKKATAKVWLAEEIPGGVARSFTIAKGDDALISIIEVLSFEGIRSSTPQQSR